MPIGCLGSRRRSAVAVIADRTAYDVRYSYRLQNVGWNSRGWHKYSLIYSFILKSAFFLADRCVLWLNDNNIATASEEVNRKCSDRNMTVQLSTPTPILSATMHIVTDRRTDRRTIEPIADRLIQ